MSFTKKANGQVNSVTEAGCLELNIPDAGATGEPAPKAYENLSKEQLIALLKERDLALAARAATKKYGLVWEEKEEDADRKGVGMVPLLVADESRFVRADPSRPTHVLIEGDNYHALKVLACTHERSVDVIYIDPPYNTGKKDFKYNDRFVDSEDGYRHSKWLSFMAKRLRLAKTLLNDTGVIFLSIDEAEFAQLKLLCDSVFGESNFIENFIWVKNSSKNDSKTTSCVHEYVLCYARDRKTVEQVDWAFRVQKKGLDEVNALVASKLAAGSSFQDVEAALKQFYRARDDLKGIKMYDRCDADGVYQLADASWPGGGGPRYEVLHPETGRPCAIPSRGWLYSQQTMADHLAKGRIWFGLDETTIPRFKRYLKSVETEVAKSVVQQYAEGFKETQELFGYKAFNNAKPTALLRLLLDLVLPERGVVVDFFAGSGSTGHAVMQLNADDGGTRQCILVTNDEGEFKATDGSMLEGGICTHVTHPRLRRVIEGYTTPAGKAVEGLKENLAFYRAEFTPDRTTHGGTKKLFEELVDTLRFKEGCFDEVQTEDGPWRLFTDNKGHHMVVLLDEFASEECAEIVARLDGTVKVYAFAYFEDDDVSDAFAHLSNVEVVLQPGRLLKALRKVHAPTQKA